MAARRKADARALFDGLERLAEQRPSDLSLLDFVHRATPRFVSPLHLKPVADLLELARVQPIRAVISAPPRHGKSELFHHAVPWRLLRDPGLRVGYATYGQRFSEKRSARMRTIARSVGVPVSDESSSKADWRTGVNDGGVWATSVGGPVTGEGFELLILDDPVKGRASAESAVERDKLWDWFNEDVFTRIEPGGSCVVFMARWHDDDLAGRLVKDGWPYLVLPAIDTHGRALWPDRWPVESLLKIREQIGEYGWASLYQGQPMPRGGALFRDCQFYDALPATYRIGKGLDLAYSGKTRADKSAAVVMLESDGNYYVVDVRTAHAKVPEFVAMLAAVDKTYPGQWHWFTSTTEAGIADLATATAGVHILSERAAHDKFTRAQGVAAAWNAGRVFVPRQAPWLDSFLAEVCGFTGVGDRHDDQVDALVSAFERCGGVMAMREREQRVQPNSLEFWKKLDEAMAVKPLADASTPPERIAQHWKDEERRLERIDERSASAKRDGQRPWWADSPFTSKRRDMPKPPF